MGTINPRPTGELQGDTSSMSDKGVNTGVTDTYGANLTEGHSGKSGISSGTKSDKAEQCLASPKPRA